MLPMLWIAALVVSVRSVPLPTGQLVIGMWCGIPEALLTQERVDEAASAGFTTISNPCSWQYNTPAYNLKLIGYAKAAGIEASVWDTRTQEAAVGKNVAANLDGVIKDYDHLQNVHSYVVTDEPSGSAFAALKKVTDGVRARTNTSHFAYINILPNYATPSQLGFPTYEEYVTAFLKEVHPVQFSYDFYPFLASGEDMSTYFENLAVVGSLSASTGTPFWQYIQAVAFPNHRATNKAEKLWQTMTTLAYGAGGVAYFTYWTPPTGGGKPWANGIVALDGTLTPEYEEVKAINRVLSVIGKYTTGAKWRKVFVAGPLASGTAPRAPSDAVYVPSKAGLLVGMFDVPGGVLALVVNMAHTVSVSSPLDVATSDGKPLLGSGGWKECPDGSRLLGERFEENGYWVCLK